MADIQFYPIDIDYTTTIFGKAVIRLFGRTLDNKTICCLDRNFEPYFYAIPEEGADIEKISSKIMGCKEDDSFVTSIVIEPKKTLGNAITALKVYVNHPKDVPIMSRLIKESIDGIKDTQETDILFVRRYLISKGITPLMMCSASGTIIKEDFNVSFVLDTEKINPGIESIDKLKVLCFDIETYASEKKYPDSRIDPIISIALYGDNFKKVITWKKINTNVDATFVNSESELISEFVKSIKEYQPDCISGYFTDGFDFPYLIERSKVNNVSLNIGIDNSQPKHNKRNLGSIRITGIPHVDLFKFVRHVLRNSLQVESNSLNDVSYALLKEKKLDMDMESIGRIWDSNNDDIGKILEYNLKDAELTYKLFNKLSQDIFELTKLIGQQLDDVIRMQFGQLVEWYLIRKTKDFNEIIPNKPGYSEKSERLAHTYQGAFVYRPKPGLYEKLAVFDFRSLYPSIIIAHNIDPGTLSQSKENSYESPELIDESGKPVHYYFNYLKRGFIPEVIKDLITRRSRVKEIIKKEKKDDFILHARSNILKLIANSAYGMFGYAGARWYSKECAASITAYGRFYILRSIEKAKKDFEVVFSDTDSVAIALGNKTKQDALNFMKEINESLHPFMELELENFYDRGLFVMKKNELQGAKKKYALLDEDNNLKIRGFEAIRRNWSYLAKEVQLKVLEIILKDNSIEEAVDYVKNIINDRRKKSIPLERAIIRTQLRKEIRHYESIGPHVKVAKNMMANGIDIGIGTVIRYVVTEGKGIIRDRAKLPEECNEKEYDAEYYINNQIIPAVKMIFESVGYSEGILTESNEQSKLNKFFGG